MFFKMKSILRKSKKNIENMIWEIHVPIKETWIFQVEASSQQDALNKFKEHHQSVQQNCSISGWPTSGDKILCRRIFIPKKK
jgi:hypothetical protein